MEYLNTIEPITMEQFLPMVIQFKMDGWRLVQICACRLPEQYELSYSFAKGFDMRTLRLTVGEDEPGFQYYAGLSLRVYTGKRSGRVVWRQD